MFTREDWTLFRTLSTISQKAGVPLSHLRALVLKELVDNALDAGANVQFGTTEGGWYWIQDDGPGLDGLPEKIAELFSIARPLTSSKMLRKPTRGALGNGLRVVAGAVLASEGDLTVTTHGQRIVLVPQDDGSTRVAEVIQQTSRVTGTRIEIKLGVAIPAMKDPWVWAQMAVNFSFTKLYQGASSPFWYDSDSFRELLLAAGEMPLTELLAQFTTFKSLFAANNFLVTAGSRFGNDPSLSAKESDYLLDLLRRQTTPIDPKQIGHMGNKLEGAGYAKELGALKIKPSRGNISAELPFCVEVLCLQQASGTDQDDVLPMVNGTPITGSMSISRRGANKVAVFGCGLHHGFNVAKQNFIATISIVIPYMPITTDGKAPDLERFEGPIAHCLEKASKGLRRQLRKEEASYGATQAEILERHLHEAVAKASGDGEMRYSLRQLFYALRPYVLSEAPEHKRELSYNYYATWVGEYESQHGELPGMYRDPRGTLYHPHTHQTISIGTIAVEKYARPEYTFNKILYIEKEGLFEVLKQTGFPERYDCALLSSKGFASRAVRDLIDLLGEDTEEIHVYCIHDADGPGTMIYQSLAGSTMARAARKIHIHNLGLEPWEALEMGLQVETFEERKSRTPIARYVDGSDQSAPDGDSWSNWLQINRVELNAMTSPQFLAWLEAKFDALDVDQKVVPPKDVLSARVLEESERVYREGLTAKILREAKFEAQVVAKVKGIREDERLDGAEIDGQVRETLAAKPVLHWTVPVVNIASKIGKV